MRMLIRCLCATLLIVPGVGAAIAPTSGGDTLVITQSVTGPTEGAVSSVVARQGTAQNTRTVMTVDIGGRKLADTSDVPLLAVRNYGTAMTRAQLAAQAKLHIVGGNYPGAAGAIEPLFTALQTTMKTAGVSVATFNFNQRVAVVGDPSPKYLIWNMVLQAGQRPIFPDPQIIDTVPMILQVRYTPRRIADGLPGAWTYPDAGTLQWRKLDAAYAPITPWTKVDVAGAYDEPVDLSGAPVDKDQGVKCLVNRAASPACPALAHVVDLMNQTGTGYAILDYGRTLQPVYDPVENPPRSGKFDQVARAAVSVDYREWSPSGCTSGAFVNRGTYGFELRSQIDRYATWINGTYRQMNSFSSQAISPTAPFDVSKTGLAGATAAFLGDKVVDVTNPGGPLLLASTIPNLLNLAPITTQSSGGGMTQVMANYYYGECGRAFGITAQCDANGNIQLTFGVGANVPHCSPVDASFYQAQTYTLRRGFPIARQVSALDYANSFAWSYDGDRTVLFRHSDIGAPPGWGVRRGMTVFASQVFFPNAGYFVRQRFPTGGPVDFYFEQAVCPGGTVGGDSIFPPGTDGYDSLQSLCFRADSSGPYFGCSMVSGTAQCATYRQAGAKVWVPSQHDPGLPASASPGNEVAARP